MCIRDRAKDVDALYVLLEYGGAEVYAATYPGERRALTGTDKLADHTVKGITPAGTTVNLFDYDPPIGNRDNDVLPDGARFENYSKGINENALLLFGGSAMREAGFWNLGSGAGRPWAVSYTHLDVYKRQPLPAVVPGCPVLSSAQYIRLSPIHGRPDGWRRSVPG